MESKIYIFFLFIFLTSCFSKSQSNTQKQSLNSNYYCQEFSVAPPKDRNWREIVMSELNSEKYPYFFQNEANSDIARFCPNFSNLSEYEKKIIWMRVLDGMVFFESTCKTDAAARGPNGTAYGLLQLHLGREHKYEDNCRKNDSTNGRRTIACGLSMIHEQIEQYRKLFFSDSYWDVLRPKGHSKRAQNIAKHIWYYPLCQGKHLAANDAISPAPNKF